jgi:RNA polymerase sigma factor (sigma-70 family)
MPAQWFPPSRVSPSRDIGGTTRCSLRSSRKRATGNLRIRDEGRRITFGREPAVTMRTDAHLVEAAKQGDRRSRERLVMRALPTIRSIAVRYRDFGLPLDDLVQEGSLGLLEAIDQYEPVRSADFDAYARFRIRRAMRNALTSQSRLIRLPKQIVERRRAIERATADLKASTGRSPTPKEVAIATGLSTEAVTAARGLGLPPLSLDEPTLEDGSMLGSVVADGSTPDPESAAVAHEEVRAIDDAVDTLPDRQRVVVQRHFGFGYEPQEIGEVAATLHVSQQRVRTIKRDALYALEDELEPIVSPRSRRRPPRRAAREYR